MVKHGHLQCLQYAHKNGCPWDDVITDETGIDLRDIICVMYQSHCKRSQAVAALRNNNGDLIDSIMDLTI